MTGELILLFMVKPVRGSTVSLYVNERKIDEEYIYKGENKYYFENVPLTVERTNVFRVVIIDIEDNETEIVKKVAGSLNIYEAGRNEGLFTNWKL